MVAYVNHAIASRSILPPPPSPEGKGMRLPGKWFTKIFSGEPLPEGWSSPARLDSACRSRAQRHLEQGSTGMIGVMLDRRRSLGWSKAPQPRALEQGSTVPAGARLNGPWSMARQGWSEQCSTIAWLEQGSTTKGPWARLDRHLQMEMSGFKGGVSKIQKKN